MVSHEMRAWSLCLKRRQVDQHGCWISLHSKNDRGYASVRLGSRPDRHTVLVHRLSMMVAIGVDRETFNSWCDDTGRILDVDHLCRVHGCFNPDHLELVAHRTNVLRGTGFAAGLAAQISCVNGHLLVQGNLRRNKRRRSCIACDRIRANIRGRIVRGVSGSVLWDEVEQEVFARDPQVAAAAMGRAA